MAELKPCPFCCEEPIYRESYSKFFEIRCNNCEYSLHEFWKHSQEIEKTYLSAMEAKQKLINKWNKRVADE